MLPVQSYVGVPLSEMGGCSRLKGQGKQKPAAGHRPKGDAAAVERGLGLLSVSSAGCILVARFVYLEMRSRTA